MLRPFIEKFLVVYFNEILIYSSTTKEQHLGHLKEMCNLLRKDKLFTNLKKCVLLTPQGVFLGFVVFENGCPPILKRSKL